MINLKNVWFIVVYMTINTLYAQEKVEIEKGIVEKDVPVNALEWFDDAYENANKVKWYYEETSGKKSYEAKLKWQGQRHSVEFSENGTIEDIEVEIALNKLPEEVRNGLEEYFKTNYSRYKIRKIQRQWTGAPDDLEDAIDEGETDVSTQYEIEYYGKRDNQKELWEGLFDEGGKLLNKRIIKLRSADNLNF